MYTPITAFLLFLGLTAQAQDIISYQESHLSANEYRSRNIGLRAPPIKISDYNLLFGAQTQTSRDLNTDYSQARLSASLLRKLDDERSLFMTAPLTYSSTGTNLYMSNESLFTNFIFSISNKWPDSPKSQWSYGFLLLDLNARIRAFPIVGFNYFTEDGLWRAGIGYPAVSVNYLGIEKTELSFLFSRETSKYYVTSENPLLANGNYIEQNLNSFGLGIRRKLTANLRMSLTYSTYFSSRYKYLNKEQNNISDYLDYSGANSISFSLGLGFDRPQQ